MVIALTSVVNGVVCVVRVCVNEYSHNSYIPSIFPFHNTRSRLYLALIRIINTRRPITKQSCIIWLNMEGNNTLARFSLDPMSSKAFQHSSLFYFVFFLLEEEGGTGLAQTAHLRAIVLF